MAKKKYRTVVGVIQFEPREGEAGEKDVRNITVRQTGFGNSAINVGATLWPSHDHVEVEKGDVVVMEGSFTQNTGEKDGEEITYNNLSVLNIAVIGHVDFGVRDEDDEDEEDAPPKKKTATKKKPATKKKTTTKKKKSPAEDEPDEDDDSDIPF